MQKLPALRQRAGAEFWPAAVDGPQSRAGALAARATSSYRRQPSPSLLGSAVVDAEQTLPASNCDGQALLGLLAGSLEQGHWRVALKRYLMLLACNVPVPACDELECRRYAAQCSDAALEKMRSDVRRWAAMVCASGVERIEFAVQSRALPRDKHEQLHAAFRPI